MSSILTVKAYFLNEVRRFQISTASTLDEIKQTFQQLLPKNEEVNSLIFSYQDDEEDWCQISNDAEWKEAIRVSKHLLRLKITRAEKPQAQASGNGSASSSPSSPQQEQQGWNPHAFFSRGGHHGHHRGGHHGHHFGNHHYQRGGCGRNFGQGACGGRGGFHPYYWQQMAQQYLPQVLSMFQQQPQQQDGNNSQGSSNNANPFAGFANFANLFQQANGGNAASSSQQQPAVHAHIVCDACNEQGIRGTRFKCNQCADYDLCEKCYKQKEKLHDAKHTFTAIDNPFQGMVNQFLNQMCNAASAEANKAQHQEKQGSSAPSAPPAPEKNQEMEEEEIILDDAAEAVVQQEQRKKQQGPEPAEDSFTVNLLTLESMGFTNKNLNLHLLKQFNNNLEKVVESLIKFNSYSAQQ